MVIDDQEARRTRHDSFVRVAALTGRLIVVMAINVIGALTVHGRDSAAF